ncbi:hypothetical protein LOTGIDRAFT_160756 [Lottia gigantea]|uniref:Uncharacterized protein n=1 Tax=Lottia gigantea TaxID=225164 RepID=V4AN16_LOTGI|nr:hypothetical protein LOTGIDRAFT_160756 [Lottia gigantea]ESO95001.1 hypothetical protein LOTGIDRAFT_160756 [Lottia gigantea]
MNDIDENVTDEKENAIYNTGVENEEKENPYAAGSKELTEQLLEISDEENLYFFNKPISSDDWSEAVSGWKASPPYPKYVQSSRKRKPVGNSDMYGIVRCVNDDDSDHYLKFWRAAVEPLTFRYVPNNALYRLNKFTQIDGEWYTVRKNKPEKVLNGSQHSPKNNRESRSKKRVPRMRSEARSQSTNSDGALTRRANRVKNLLPYHPEFLQKSASDLFMENLDSKLNQVENQVKQNMQNKKIVTKQSNEHLYRPKSKNMVVSFEVVDSNNDACSISSSIASQTLRPLEKVTPKQRMKSVELSKDSEAKNIHDSPKIHVDSSIVFEGVQSQHVKNSDNIQNDSYLIGKGNIMNSSKSPMTVPLKKKGAILKYTTANSSNSKKNNLWDPTQGTNGTDIVSGFMGDLPEVSGKQIPVSFSSQRLFRQ